MTTYRIQAPDGNTYTIDGPDGASDADVRAAVLTQHPNAGTGVTLRDVVPDPAKRIIDQINGNPVMGAAAGVIKSGAQNLYGLKDLASKIGIGDGLDDEDRQNLARFAQINSGSATAGQIAGNVGMMAIPGSVVGSALPRTLALSRVAVPIADAAANAGTAAIAMPEQGQTRGSNAALGALGSVGGSALGGLGKGETTAAFQSFMDLADKILPSTIRGAIGFSPLAALHYVAPRAAVTVDAGLGGLATLHKIGSTDAGKAFATGTTRAQQYLQRALPGAIDYLSQVGAGAAEGANE